MSLRRQLGPVYTEYPAKQVGDYLGDKLFKLVATIICCALWTGVYYIIIGVVNFNRKNFVENAEEMTTGELFATETSLWVLVACYIVIMIIVFRSRIGEKTVRKRTR